MVKIENKIIVQKQNMFVNKKLIWILPLLFLLLSMNGFSVPSVDYNSYVAYDNSSQANGNILACEHCKGGEWMISTIQATHDSGTFLANADNGGASINFTSVNNGTDTVMCATAFKISAVTSSNMGLVTMFTGDGRTDYLMTVGMVNNANEWGYLNGGWNVVSTVPSATTWYIAVWGYNSTSALGHVALLEGNGTMRNNATSVAPRGTGSPVGAGFRHAYATGTSNYDNFSCWIVDDAEPLFQVPQEIIIPPATPTMNVFMNNYDNWSAFDRQQGQDSIISTHLYISETGVAINSSNCSHTLFDNVSIVTGFDKGNFTFCKSGQGCNQSSPMSIMFNNVITLGSPQSDFVDVSICHENVINEPFTLTDIWCNGSVVDDLIIPANDMPSCDDDFGFFRLSLGQNCINASSIWMNATSTATFVQRHRIDEIEFDRQYAEFTENLTYNATFEKYHYVPAHPYEYYTLGTVRINHTCIGTDPIVDITQTRIFTIGDIPPEIFHSQIQTELEIVQFNNGTVFNSTNFSDSLVVFLTTVIDDNFLNSTHTITNLTGSLIWNETHNESGGDAHNVSARLFHNATGYNFTTIAYDESNNKSVLSTIFVIYLVDDVVNPVITGINPFMNGTEYGNTTTVTFNATCYDTNLWQMRGNLTFNSVEVASVHESGLAMPLDSVSVQYTFMNSGNGSIVWECGDRGTDIYLDTKDFSYNDKTFGELTFENKKDPFNFKVTHDSDNVYEDYSVKKLKDSYAWELCLTSPKTKGQSWTVTEYIDGDFIYLDDSSIPAHFISQDGKTWIKYLDENKKPLNVDSVKFIAGQWVVMTSYTSDVICHDPLTGSTNTDTKTFTFTVLATPLPEPEPDTTLITFDLTKQVNVIMLFVFLFFYFGLLVIGNYFKNYTFTSFAFFIGIVVGLMLSGLSIFLTLLFFIMNVTLFIKSADMK